MISRATFEINSTKWQSTSLNGGKSLKKKKKAKGEEFENFNEEGDQQKLRQSDAFVPLGLNKTILLLLIESFQVTSVQ